MNLRDEILLEHSKTQSLKIAKYIGEDKQRFDDLMHLFLSDEYRVCQRAAWIVEIITENYPYLIEPYIEKMLQNLKNDVHPAVTRNSVRVLNNLKELPNSSLGLAASLCFKYLESPSVQVATRVHSMRLLHKICLIEPELINELTIIIENFIDHESPAFKAAGRDVLNKIKKNKR